jgi:triacylglycerol lipase
VDGVLAKTGAAKVDIVGHSQGGMMPRYSIKNLGGAAKVDDLVGLAPSNHGTTNPLAPYGGATCPACVEQAAGSPFITALNAGDETPGDVSYTQIETRYDEVVTPYTSAFLSGGTNVLLQDKCPADVSEHLAIVGDPIALQWALDALSHPGPASPGLEPTCG